MNDKEFIELLNLYVDREITTEDAVRLEKVVATNARRREIYDQYCRIQKACSMLSEETLDMSSVRTTATVIAFPVQSPWRFGPVMAGLAAMAACTVAIVGFRNHSGPIGLAANDSVRPVSVSSPAALTADSIAMKPVLSVRVPTDAAPRGAHLLTDLDPQTTLAQLNWIGDIHLAPVAPSAAADFLLNPKTDLKAGAMTDSQTSRDALEPSEMTAFRFQR
jgi:hypothetical protein